MAVTTQSIEHYPYYCAGVIGIRTAFMLSAPGNKEEEKGWPASGDTGDNLETVLVDLNVKFPAIFPYARSRRRKVIGVSPRHHYRIINTVEAVYPNQNTRRTEPPLRKVYEERNRIRLLKVLSDIDVVVCLGDTAIKAYRHLLRYGVTALMIPGRHLSNRSLCQIDVGDDGTPEECRQQRTAIAAEEIIAYISIVEKKSPLLHRSKGE